MGFRARGRDGRHDACVSPAGPDGCERSAEACAAPCPRESEFHTSPWWSPEMVHIGLCPAHLSGRGALWKRSCRGRRSTAFAG